MIPLDIYKEIYHNKVKNKCTQPFDNKLEAWLALLSMDDPEVVVQLITEYPEFKAIYEEAYRMCVNTEEVMQMFSKELAELDRNTVQLMIDEMQDEINAQKKELDEQAEVLKDKDKMLEDKEKELEDKEKKIEEEQKKQEKYRKQMREMIAAIYSNVKDVNKVAQLTGCSVVEVQSVLETEEA